MSRERMPNRRASTTFEFQHAGLAYTCSHSCFGDGRPGEVFLQNHKGGSSADVAARESAIAASLALQHGCSIQVLQRALLRNPNGEAAGDIGVTSAELIASDLYRDRRIVHVSTIKAHVDQINDLLSNTAWRISSDGGRWFLCRRRS